ncbi:glycosyltransferase [Cyanobium sp. FACHB-13342]|nr:glycosyltransferase [Cyanobium sp. FACHB-13342]
MTTVSCLGSVYSGTLVCEFRSSVDSLLRGSCLPDQIVVVVDGPISSDLASVIDAYKESGSVRVVDLPHNLGLAKALNAGLDACVADLICRFDTDDISFSTRISSIKSEFASDPSLDILGSAVVEFSPFAGRGNFIKLKRVARSHRAVSLSMPFVNPLNHPSVAIRRASLESVGGYSHQPFFEDYYLWLVARKAGLVFRNLESPQVFIRRSSVLGRRCGLPYALCECRFYLRCLKSGLLPSFLIPVYIIRCMSRLLPRPLQAFQDFLPWRTSIAATAYPELVAWLEREC